ncbi:hypothetical protein AB4Z46_26970 [Variovorax sp. M-6]|uniref:hypothetical protein n=1 Tax=Variovorax sp. M-6 TaxID=3233041 RepID=UPI003F9E828F
MNAQAAPPIQSVAPFLMRRSAVVWVAVALAMGIFAVPMIPYLAYPADLWVHIEYAKTIHGPADIVSPHFLFQLLLIAVTKVSGLSFNASAIALISICYGGMAGMIAAQIRRAAPVMPPWAILAVSVLVLLASHIFLQTAFKLNFLYGYIAPTVYHNPTQVLSKVLALAVTFAYFAIALENGKASRVQQVLLPIGVVLSAVAKPSFLIAFVPCVCLWEFYRVTSGQWRLAARNLLLVVLPAVIVLALQFRMTYTAGGTGGGLAFAPFLVYGGAADVLSKLPASLLFPVVAAVVIWRGGGFDSRMRFVWLLYGIGMIISTCIVEAGPRMMQGNFAWTGQTVTFLLYVQSAIALCRLPRRSALPGWVAFAPHVVFGAVWYSAALFMPLGTFL